MSNEKNRILGRLLAVEEAAAVSGARCTLTEYDTSCLETYPTSDSGTASAQPSNRMAEVRMVNPLEKSRNWIDRR
mgnify:CR=1 FL=1